MSTKKPAVAVVSHSDQQKPLSLLRPPLVRSSLLGIQCSKSLEKVYHMTQISSSVTKYDFEAGVEKAPIEVKQHGYLFDMASENRDLDDSGFSL